MWPHGGYPLCCVPHYGVNPAHFCLMSCAVHQYVLDALFCEHDQPLWSLLQSGAAVAAEVVPHAAVIMTTKHIDESKMTLRMSRCEMLQRNVIRQHSGSDAKSSAVGLTPCRLKWLTSSAEIFCSSTQALMTGCGIFNDFSPSSLNFRLRSQVSMTVRCFFRVSSLSTEIAVCILSYVHISK